MTAATFINMAVKDLTAATVCFRTLGFAVDDDFSDDNGARVIINDGTSVMLMVEPNFEAFVAPAARAATPAQREMIIGLSADSRDQVDELVDRAIAAGGATLGEPRDDGFMYMRGFLDLDGHQWSFLHMDMSASEDE